MLVATIAGWLLRANLRSEMLTQVKHACMESDGTISVIRADGARPPRAG